jgi:hypothetical protein
MSQEEQDINKILDSYCKEHQWECLDVDQYDDNNEIYSYVCLYCDAEKQEIEPFAEDEE